MTYQHEIVTIRDVELSPIQFNGQRVVTLAMIDQVHGRPEGTAGRNFRENRNRFIQGEDFFELTADEIRRQSLDPVFASRTAKAMLFSESGYLMLVKSFTDELAWQVQRELVKSYFRVRAPAEPIKTTITAAKLFRPLFQIARLIGCKKNAAAISANQAVIKHTTINLLADLGQTHLSAENQTGKGYCPRDLGAFIDVSAQAMNKQLLAAGLQTKDVHGDWQPTDAAEGLYEWVDTMRRHKDGTPVKQLLWFKTALKRIEKTPEIAPLRLVPRPHAV